MWINPNESSKKNLKPKKKLSTEMAAISTQKRNMETRVVRVTQKSMKWMTARKVWATQNPIASKAKTKWVNETKTNNSKSMSTSTSWIHSLCEERLLCCVLLEEAFTSESLYFLTKRSSVREPTSCFRYLAWSLLKYTETWLSQNAWTQSKNSNEARLIIYLLQI